jgi:hypothetical protein
MFAALGSILATFPALALLPLRQAHWLSDPPYFMGVGFCLGLSIACLTKALAFVRGNRSQSSTILRPEDGVQKIG